MENRKLRTAAYCRVSTGTDLQDGSFETQCAYYQKRIEEDATMVSAGIYGDQGKSGRSIRNRPALQELLRDCEAGQIDLVLTKSVSRFARNLQECVEMTRRLSDLGVSIRFEREGLDTGTMEGELMLGILAAIAQEESRSISENTIWGIRKRYERGIPRWSRLYGYTRSEDGSCLIIPDQAETVQTIFRLYEHGHTIREIAAHLESHAGRLSNSPA